MHFLGLSGMPRRIPDYPDTFYLWNSVATFGSYITTFSLFVFCLLLYYAFNSFSWSADFNTIFGVKSFLGNIRPFTLLKGISGENVVTNYIRILHSINVTKPLNYKTAG